jgi:hypothetical protein
MEWIGSCGRRRRRWRRLSRWARPRPRLRDDGTDANGLKDVQAQYVATGGSFVVHDRPEELASALTAYPVTDALDTNSTFTCFDAPGACSSESNTTFRDVVVRPQSRPSLPGASGGRLAYPEPALRCRGVENGNTYHCHAAGLRSRGRQSITSCATALHGAAHGDGAVVFVVRFRLCALCDDWLFLGPDNRNRHQPRYDLQANDSIREH